MEINQAQHLVRDDNLYICKFLALDGLIFAFRLSESMAQHRVKVNLHRLQKCESMAEWHCT